MVAYLGLRTHELLYEEIGNIIDDIFSACEKAECYEEIANHSQRIFTLIQNDFSYMYDIGLEYVENGWLPRLRSPPPLNYQSLYRNFHAHSEMSNHLI